MFCFYRLDSFQWNWNYHTFLKQWECVSNTNPNVFMWDTVKLLFNKHRWEDTFLLILTKFRNSCLLARVILTFNFCRILTKLACELIAVASQNNPPCQKAFLPALAKLLELVRDVKSTEDIRIQAVRAISSRCFLTINGTALITKI